MGGIQNSTKVHPSWVQHQNFVWTCPPRLIANYHVNFNHTKVCLKGCLHRNSHKDSLLGNFINMGKPPCKACTWKNSFLEGMYSITFQGAMQGERAMDGADLHLCTCWCCNLGLSIDTWCRACYKLPWSLSFTFDNTLFTPSHSQNMYKNIPSQKHIIKNTYTFGGSKFL